MTRAQYEYAAITFLAVITLAFFLPAIQYARTEIRDDLRREDITNLKRALEQYNNTHQAYVSPPNQTSPACTDSSDANSWFFGATSLLLKEKKIDAIPHDRRENQGFLYRYCVTDFKKNQAQGFYLEARVEVGQLDQKAFDEDEHRKFDYRILHDQGRTLYRVCGGTEKQCQK